jgi:hypothetical protein
VRIVVQKFGGSSIADPELIRNVARGNRLCIEADKGILAQLFFTTGDNFRHFDAVCLTPLVNANSNNWFICV